MRLLMVVTIAVGLLLVTAMPTGAQEGPALTVTAPSVGAVIQGSDVTIEFDVAGFNLVTSEVPLAEAGQRPEANRPGEGHLHFMLDLQPVIVWERSEPYTLSDVAPGEHQLMVELVNNDHSPLSPPVVQQIRFRAASGQVMPASGSESLVFAPRYTWLIALGTLAIGASTLLTLRRRKVHGRPGE